MIHNFKHHPSTLDSIEISEKSKKKSLYTKNYMEKHIIEGELNNDELEGKCKIVTKDGTMFEGNAYKQNLTGVFKTLSGATIEGRV